MAPRLDFKGDTINPRTVNKRVFNQPPGEDVLNDRGLSGFVFQWGQFLEGEDLRLT